MNFRLFLVAIALAHSNAQTPVGKTIVSRLDPNQYKAHIVGLAQFGDRERGTIRNMDAARWLEKKLRGYGYTNVVRYKFSDYLRTPLENVYATKVGTTRPNEMYILSCHFDGRGGGQAADDNASGCSTILEIARVLAMKDVATNVSVRFIFWNNEEFGMDGSSTYAASRASKQGTTEEPKWLGVVQHDTMMYDHGMPPGPRQSPKADINVEYAERSTFGPQSAKLAAAWQAANKVYAQNQTKQYPVTLGKNMAGTDSIMFEDLAPSISVRENERILGIEMGSHPQHHTPMDRVDAYSPEDYAFGFTAVKTSMGALVELAGVKIKP